MVRIHLQPPIFTSACGKARYSAAIGAQRTSVRFRPCRPPLPFPSRCSAAGSAGASGAQGRRFDPCRRDHQRRLRGTQCSMDVQPLVAKLADAPGSEPGAHGRAGSRPAEGTRHWGAQLVEQRTLTPHVARSNRAALANFHCQEPRSSGSLPCERGFSLAPRSSRFERLHSRESADPCRAAITLVVQAVARFPSGRARTDTRASAGAARAGAVPR